MARSYKRTCLVCQQEYEYCMHCDKFAKLPKWMMLFHDDNCREIFNTMSAYENAEISKDEAKARLNACDFTRKPFYSKTFSKKIDSILNTKAKKAIVDEAVVSNTTENVIEDTPKKAARAKKDVVVAEPFDVKNIDTKDCEEII